MSVLTPSEPAHLLVPALKIHVTYILTYMHEILLLQNPSVSQMLTTDPGDSDECYACKLLEVLIIHCHHSLMQVGGTGSLVGGGEIQMGV